MRSKYRPKFRRELLDGLRAEGFVIEECCIKWGVTVATYYNWVNTIPKFKEAHEFGDMQFKAFFARKYRAVANGDEKGNAGMLIFAAKNAMGWADKVETHTTHEEELRTIRIEMLPSKPELKLLDNVIDITDAKGS